MGLKLHAPDSKIMHLGCRVQGSPLITLTDTARYSRFSSLRGNPVKKLNTGVGAEMGGGGGLRGGGGV